MMSRAFIFVFCVQFLSAQIVFASSVQDFVGKIESFELGNSQRFEGSGLLFKDNDKIYVMTSEHVIARAFGNLQYRLKVRNMFFDLELMTLDWGMGLGLFKIKETESNLQNIQQLKTKITSRAELTAITVPSPGVEVVAAGFPNQSPTLFLSNQGVLESHGQVRGLFVDNVEMLTIRSAATEFGMSGGVILQSLNPIGIISHRRQVDQTTYAIPISIANEWLDRYFSEGPRVTLTRVPQRSGCIEPHVGTGNYAVCQNRNSQKISLLYITNRSYTPNLFAHEIFSNKYIGPYVATDQAPFFPIFDVEIVNGKPKIVVSAGLYPNGQAPGDFSQSLDILIFKNPASAQPSEVIPKNLVEFFQILKDPSYTIRVAR